MSSFVSTVKSQLFASIPDDFVDPVTKSKPSGERELSAALAYWHHQDKIDWRNIQLRNSDGMKSNKFASELFQADDYVGLEYPLFCLDEHAVNRWGGMAADLIFFSSNRDRIVLVENKIGSNFTSGGDDPATGQLGRQADYLLAANEIIKRVLVIFTAEEFILKSWYSSGLSKALSYNDRAKTLEGYLICWEDVFKSLRCA